MRIKEEDYTELNETMLQFLKEKGYSLQSGYKAFLIHYKNKPITNWKLSFAWLVFHGIDQSIVQRIRDYCNDTHIDTALKNIVVKNI